MSQPRKLDPALQSMLHGLATSDMPEQDVRREQREMKLEALRDAFRRIHATDPYQFQPGDLVQWQPGLKYTRWPQYGEAAVVVECLDPPLLDCVQGAGSPYFRSPNTVLLGLQRDDGFHCWHFDGRRFELAVNSQRKSTSATRVDA